MSSIEHNAHQIAHTALQRFSDANRRILVAIAGAPGSGKSTLVERAAELINEKKPMCASILPMDGFHYDDRVLESMGRLEYKGAIDTFDVYGLRHMLQRLKENKDDTVAVPVFDRTLEISRAGGRLISNKADIILCEGNYLLTTQSPWDQLKPLFDLSVFIDVDEEELSSRLRARWETQGLDEAEINRRVEENDLPNGIGVISSLSEPDLRLKNL